MKMFAFKNEMPTTIEELNNFERRQMNDDRMYDTVMTIIFATIAMILIGMACSYVAQKLNTFNEQVQKSFIVS